jgi:pyruvate/2-oxoglutarate dehydrogenase complex dihydrolipoamide acyltransferase (E2) component
MIKISRNIQFDRPKRLSSWRKVAIGTWKTVGDPSVYGMMDLDATKVLQFIESEKTKTGERITVTHFVGRAIAETIARHPEINSILRFGRLYPRKNVDIFFQVATDMSGHDLSGVTIRDVHTKSIHQIAKEMSDVVTKVRKGNDISFKKMKKMMGTFPGFLSPFLIGFSSFIMYTLNIWTSLLGVPKDPFGSALVTNIGSLSLETAFVPLVPYCRVPLLIALGAVKDRAEVVDGKVVVLPMIRLCVTFDHRVIDGVHASHMCRTIKRIFEHPETELVKA